jgi:acyl transferase domain-containing protein
MFDPETFGLSEAEVLDMDPHQRLTLTVCAEALRNAGLRGDQPNFYWDEKAKGVPEEKADIGVFVGIGVAAADAATIALQVDEDA